jgi:hypothetical protein
MILEIDTGDGGTILWMQLMTLNCRLKKGSMGKVNIIFILSRLKIFKK